MTGQWGRTGRSEERGTVTLHCRDRSSRTKCGLTIRRWRRAANPDPALACTTCARIRRAELEQEIVSAAVRDVAK